uniref:RNase H domain-containing protein n=1 Tax=Strongyloides stercoralis TaxID=6248 RepID=A0A0K0ELP8_STRER
MFVYYRYAITRILRQYDLLLTMKGNNFVNSHEISNYRIELRRCFNEEKQYYFVYFGCDCSVIYPASMKGLEDTFMLVEGFCLSMHLPPFKKISSKAITNLSDQPYLKIIHFDVERISLQTDDEFYNYVKELPDNTSYLLINGSIYNGTIIGLYGVLEEHDIILSVQNFLKRISNAPRLELEVLHSAIKIITYFQIKTCTIFSDNSYCVNAINKHWLKNWVATEDTTKKYTPVYLST